jgi:hypothetical protein
MNREQRKMMSRKTRKHKKIIKLILFNYFYFALFFKNYFEESNQNSGAEKHDEKPENFTKGVQL